MMPHGPTPEELLASVAQRDEKALGELYDRFAPRLLGMLFAVLSDRSAAEEALEDVFLRVWHDARRFARQRVSLGAWLFLMARLIGVDRMRSARQLPRLIRDDPDPLQKSLAWLPRPEETALLDERRDLLKKVINQLPEPQRRALELAVFQGYTQSEIALKLDEPLGRVKSGLRAAMRFLRHRLRAVMGTWTANI